MRNDRTLGSLAFCAAAAIALASAACNPGGGSQTSSATSTGSLASGTLAVGTVNSLGFYVQAIFQSASVLYYLHEQTTPGGSGSLLSACNVPLGSLATTVHIPSSNGYLYGVNDLYCMLDVSELDLYLNSIQMNFNAPAGACNYVSTKPYSAYMYQPGSVSGSYSVTINEIPSPPSVTFGPLPRGIYDGRLVGGQPGEVACAFDYSPYGGPNCCNGVVQGEETIITTNGTGSAPVDTFFSGNSSACLGGPWKAIGPLDKNGDPETPFYNAIQGINTSYTVQSASSLGLPTGNLFAANFWEPSYWNPAAMGIANFHPSTFPPQSAPGTYLPNGPCMIQSIVDGSLVQTTDPTCSQTNLQALPPPLDPTMPLQGAANPYYNFLCQDQAGENFASINIIVRSWDTVAGWTNYNNPYTDGNNPSWLNDQLHDFGVWEDFNYTGQDPFVPAPTGPPLVGAPAAVMTSIPSPYYPYACYDGVAFPAGLPFTSCPGSANP